MFRGKGKKKLGKVGRWLLLALTPYGVLCLVLLINFFLTHSEHCPLPTIFEQDFWIFPSVVQSWLFYVVAIPLVEIILIPFGFLLSAIWLAVRSIFKPELRKMVWRRVFLVLPFAIAVVGSLFFGWFFILLDYFLFEWYEIDTVIAVAVVIGLVLTALAAFGSIVWLLVAGILEKRSKNVAVKKQGTWTIVAAALNFFGLFGVLFSAVFVVFWVGSVFDSPSYGGMDIAVSVPTTTITSSMIMSGVSTDVFESADTLGFAVGGAKDIDNFRENIDTCYLPVPTDITYQGLYFDYQFATQNKTSCSALFCPQYEAAILPDPFSKKDEYFLSVGLGSGMQVSEFTRPPLDVVVVLDISGSMGSPFDTYYYDRFRTPESLKKVLEDDWSTPKMEIAKEAVQAMVDHLESDDRFGMVLFESDAERFIPFQRVGAGRQEIKNTIATLSERGGTNMEAGMTLGTQVIESLSEVAGEDRERRIIFLTDAMPNTGVLEENALYTIGKENAQKGVHTTFIGIGVDFNTELVEVLTRDLRGANYFAVHSSSDFEQRLDTEFAYLIAPLLYDLTLTIEGGDYEIQAVYGSPEADEATGAVLKVTSLFPSPTVDGESRGGVLLAHLKKRSNTGVPTKVVAAYTDRAGVRHSEEQVVHWSEEAKRSPSDSVRKAVLLARYVSLLQNWTIDENLRQGPHEKTIVVPIQPGIFYDDGIIIPRKRYPDHVSGYGTAELSQWERLSRPLVVSKDYQEAFSDFMDYFTEEYRGLSEKGLLKRELDLLDDLIHSPAPSVFDGKKVEEGVFMLY